MFKSIVCIFILLLLLSCSNEGVKSKVDVVGSSVSQGEISVDKKEEIDVSDQVLLPDMDQVMGKFNPATDSNFVRIDHAYTDKPVIFLQKEAYSQFIKMHNAAMEEGIDLMILSATRPFDYQKNIWERKWANLLASGSTDGLAMVTQILRYSAMPGTSRHHWGTDIDLNYLSNSNFDTGNGKKIYTWLKNHAHKYGFCQPYTVKNDDRPYGYEEEKWHWSYMPIAENYFTAAKLNLKNSMIRGFSGAEYADSLNVVQKYVLGIDPKCN